MQKIKLKIITNFQIIEKFIKDMYLLKVKLSGRAQNKTREVNMTKKDKNKVEDDDEIIEENELDGLDDEDLEDDDLDDSDDIDEE